MLEGHFSDALYKFISNPVRLLVIAPPCASLGKALHVLRETPIPFMPRDSDNILKLSS